MATIYDTNYTVEQIDAYLKSLKECIDNGSLEYSRGRHRKENSQFLVKYNLTDADCNKTLCKLTAKEFVGTLKNEDSRYPLEVLYVFMPTEKLFDGNTDVLVLIYIKFNLIKNGKGNFMYVVSLHEPAYTEPYCFK